MSFSLLINNSIEIVFVDFFFFFGETKKKLLIHLLTLHTQCHTVYTFGWKPNIVCLVNSISTRPTPWNKT